MKEKEEGLSLEAIVVEAVKGLFRVEVVKEGEVRDEENPGHVILAHIAGKLRKNFIRIVPGDRVMVEVSPYDYSRGRITYRMKG